MARPGINIDKEQVRMLVLSLGVRPAARQLGLREATVQQWSAQGKWLAHCHPNTPPATPPPPASMTNTTKPTKCPADVLRDILADDEHATKLGLSRAVRKSVTSVREGVAIENAADLKAVAQTAALIHRWEEPGASGTRGLNIVSAVQINVTTSE